MANLKDAKIVDFDGLQFYHKNLMKKVDSKLTVTDNSVGGYQQQSAGYFKSIVSPVTIQIPDYSSFKLYFAGTCDIEGSNVFGDDSECGIVYTTSDSEVEYDVLDTFTYWLGIKGSTSPYIYNLNGVITNGSVYCDTNDPSIINSGPVFSPCNVNGAEGYGITSIDWVTPYCYKFKQSTQIGDVIIFAYTPSNDDYCYLFGTTDGINLTYLNRIQYLKYCTGLVYTGRRLLVTGYDSSYSSIEKDSSVIDQSYLSDPDSIMRIIKNGFNYYSSMNFSKKFYENAVNPETGNSLKTHIIALDTFKGNVIATFVKNSEVSSSSGGYGGYGGYGGSSASEPKTVGPVYLMKYVSDDTWEDLEISNIPEIESIFTSNNKLYAVPYDSAAMIEAENKGDYMISGYPLFESKDCSSWTECSYSAVVDIWDTWAQDMGCRGGVALGNKILKANYVFIENKGIPVDMVMGLEDALKELSSSTIDMSYYIASDEAINSIITNYAEA